MPNSTIRNLRSKVFWRLYDVPLWKKVCFPSLAIIAILAIIGGFIAWRDVSKVTKFNREISELIAASESNDFEKVNEITEREVSKDSHYLALERGVKKYIRAESDEMQDLAWTIGDEGIMSVLDTESIRQDDENFSAAHGILETARGVIAEKRDHSKVFFTEEGALSFVDEDQLGEELRDIYLEYTVTSENNEAFDAAYMDMLDLADILIDSYEEAIGILASHRDDWYLEGEALLFSNDDTRDEFATIIDEASTKLEEYLGEYDAVNTNGEVSD